MNSIPQYPETLCPNFTDIVADPDKNKGWLLLLLTETGFCTLCQAVLLMLLIIFLYTNLVDMLLELLNQLRAKLA